MKKYKNRKEKEEEEIFGNPIKNTRADKLPIVILSTSYEKEIFNAKH